MNWQVQPPKKTKTPQRDWHDEVFYQTLLYTWSVSKSDGATQKLVIVTKAWQVQVAWQFSLVNYLHLARIFKSKQSS